VVCVLQTAAIIYLWTAKQDAHRFQYLTGDGAFDTKTGQVCYAGVPKVDYEDWYKLKTRLPLCKDLR
jgi:hypothetical protein